MATLTHKKILIVEDETDIAQLVKLYLEKDGFRTAIATTGAESLKLIKTDRPDMVILDLMLPEMDGLEVCKKIRSTPDTALLPILMLTARDTVDDRVAGLDAGADDYLVKPFALKELLARLRALMRRATDAPKATTLTMVDLTLDTLTRRVKRAGQLIELTAKEYAVLECLMRAPARVLTRTVIAEHVWNYDVFNQSNVVDVYIRNLRRKIDDNFAVKLIQTIRGAGYCLSSEDETT